MTKKDIDEGSWFWGLFWIMISLVLWHVEGWGWTAGSIFTFLMGFFTLPPLAIWCEGDVVCQTIKRNEGK